MKLHLPLPQSNVDWRNKDKSYANLNGKNLKGAILYRTNFTGAELRGVRLLGANLNGADLRDADLAGADLAGADLRNADLTNAKLQGINLLDAVVQKSQFGVGIGLTEDQKSYIRQQGGLFCDSTPGSTNGSSSKWWIRFVIIPLAVAAIAAIGGGIYVTFPTPCPAQQPTLPR